VTDEGGDAVKGINPASEAVRPLLRLGLQYARFGTIGLAAAAIHVLMFAAAIELAGLAALVANFVAFGIAVVVSFFGHSRWTFRGQTGGGGWHRQRTALVRFIIVAMTGLALNSLAVYVVVNLLAWPYYYAIVVMLFVVPLVVFALSKFWAFAPA
jgi:putative flippase GtrA